MTDDQILLLVDTVCPKREYLRTMSNQDLIAFAQAVAQRTLTNQKARWYQEGVEAEREACAKLCESMRPWSCAKAIRARGE
jgi:thioesterase domain-containing protein